MHLSEADALRAYARMMNTLDSSQFERLLADDFHFASQLVLDEITSKDEFLAYIRPKLETIARSGSPVFSEMGEWDAYGGGPCVITAQGTRDNLVGTAVAKTLNGKITRIDLCIAPPPQTARRTGEYPSSEATAQLPSAGTFPQPANLTEVRERLYDEAYWRSLAGNDLQQMVLWSMLLYGKQLHQADVPRLAALYVHFVSRTEANSRTQLLRQVRDIACQSDLPPPIYIPVLAFDPDDIVVSEAVIDMVMISEPLPDGSPAAFAELEPMFRKRTIQNRGAAFGGLVALGDARFRPLLERVKLLLTLDELRVAARTRTASVTDAQVRFWLDWAEELVNDHSPEGEAAFGLVASALVILPRDNRTHEVVDAERRYPGQRQQHAVVIQRSWTTAEYAQLIAKRLHALSEAEAEPKVFLTVLQQWGLGVAGAESEPEQEGWRRYLGPMFRWNK